MPDESPEATIERALVRIRREQQAQRLQQRDAEAAKTDGARYRYLDALEDAGDGRPISEVAEAIGVDRPRASRLTTDLLATGLIERHPHPADARISLVLLTAQGQTLVNHMHQHRRQAVTQALAGFTDAEAGHLADLLSRFIDAWTNPSTQA